MTPKYKIGDKVYFKTRKGYLNYYKITDMTDTHYHLKCYKCGDGDRPEYDAPYPIETTDAYAFKVTKLHKALM